MLRVVLSVVLPLLLPTALYLAWVWISHAVRPGDRMRWGGLPWVWLAGAGALLVALVLFVVTVGFGTTRPGVYVPPRWQNGHIEQGHVEPGRRP